jgi:Domain of unknown function (DUF4905)
MPVFNLFGHRTISPAWDYKVPGLLWRLVPTESGLLVGEERDVERKRTGFFCVYQSTGELLWQSSDFEEQWWIGIESTHRDRLFLHGYATPDMPLHMGITAVDLFTGKRVWRRPDLKFLATTGESVFASRDVGENRVVLEVRISDGELLCEIDVNDKRFKEDITQTETHPTDAPIMPRPIDVTDEVDQRTIRLIHGHINSWKVVGQVVRLVRNGLLVFSFHERMGNASEGHLRNLLGIIDVNSGGRVWSETLNRDVRSIAPESFFVHGAMLFYVKERTTLVAMNLDNLHI